MSQRDYFEKDYYAALGVPKDASQADISKAYRKLARQLHPDARPDDKGAEERFKEVSEAHAVLSNPDKRKEYDKVRELAASGAFGGFGGQGFGGQGFGGAGFGGQGFGGAGFGGSGGAGGQAFDIGDLLGNLFGGGRGESPFGGARTTRGTRARRGQDVEASLTLSFEDAMAGVTTTLRVDGPAPCATCGGSGAAPGTSPVTCPVCRGTGAVAQDQGMFSFSEPCTACGGSGRQVPTPCPTCSGSGRQLRTREIRARIPAGVSDGARIRLKGKGEPGPAGGPPGDLYVRVSVTPHPLFARKGDDLTVRVPVSMTEAALGTRVTVPTLGEPVTVKIPAGTEPGRTLRVRGRGTPKAGGGHGDLLVTVDVVVPKKLSRHQRKLLEDFAATDGGEQLREHLRQHIGGETRS